MSINKNHKDYEDYINRKILAKLYNKTKKVEEENIKNLHGSSNEKEELLKLKDIYENVYLKAPKLRPESIWVSPLIEKIEKRLKIIK